MIPDPSRRHRCPDGSTLPRHAPLPEPLAEVLRGFTAHRWWRHGRCYGSDPDEWFPPPGADPDPVVQRICHRCPVRWSCLAHALAEGEYGVWGGLTDVERSQARQAILDTGQPVEVFLELLEQAPLSAQARRIIAEQDHWLESA